MELLNRLEKIRKHQFNSGAMPATVSPRGDLVIKIIFALIQYPFHCLWRGKETLLTLFINRTRCVVYNEELEEYEYAYAANESIAYAINYCTKIETRFSFLYLSERIQPKWWHQYYSTEEKVAFESDIFRKIDFFFSYIYLLLLGEMIFASTYN